MGGAGEVWHLGNGPAFALPSRRFEEMILRRGRRDVFVIGCEKCVARMG